jgi:hypothetical protein
VTREEIRALLDAPFGDDEVKFKPQAVKDGRAMAVPYVDARTVMDRLDDVFGVGGWQTSYRECNAGIVCSLTVMIDGVWITHEDSGGQSEQPDEGDRQKSAFSDSLKRAAVQLGVGRYLYRQKPQWVDYDAQKRRFTGTPRPPVWTPHRPVRPPGQAAPQAAPQRPTGVAQAGAAAIEAQLRQAISGAPATALAPAAAPAPTVYERICAVEKEMVDAGKCVPGALVSYLKGELGATTELPIEEWPAKMAKPLVAPAIARFKDELEGADLMAAR